MSTSKFTAKRNLVMSPKVTKGALVVRPLGPHLRTNSNTTRGTDSTSHSSGDDLPLADPKTTSMPLRQSVIPFGEFGEHDDPEMDGCCQYGAFGDFSEFTAHPSRENFQAAPSNTRGLSQATDFVIQDDGESEYEEESIDDEEYEAYMASQRELTMSQGEIEYIEEWVPVDADDEEFEEITVGSDEYDAYLQHLVGEGAASGCAGEVLAIIGRELKVEKSMPADPGNSSEPKAAEEKKKKKIKKLKKKETKDKKEKGSDEVKLKKSCTSSGSKTKLKSSTSPVKTPKSTKKELTSSDEQKTTDKVKKPSKITLPKASKKSTDCSLSVKTPDSDSPSKSRKRVPSLSLSPVTPEEEAKQTLESSTNGVKLTKETKEVQTKKIKTHKSHAGTKVSPSRPSKETTKDVSLSIKSSSKVLKLKKPKSLSNNSDECSQSVASAPLETRSKSKKRSSSRKSTDSVGGSSARSILSAPNLRSSKILKARKDRIERKKAKLGIEDNSESLASLSSKLKKSAKSSSKVSETKKVKSSNAENEVSLKSPTKSIKVTGSKSSKVSTKDNGGTDLSKSSNASTKEDAGAKEATKGLTSSTSKKASSKSMTMVVKPSVVQDSPRRSVRVVRYRLTKGED